MKKIFNFQKNNMELNYSFNTIYSYLYFNLRYAIMSYEHEVEIEMMNIEESINTYIEMIDDLWL